MEFNIVDNASLDETHIPIAESIQIAIPTAEPVIRILTWDQMLQLFVKKSRVQLDPTYLEKITNFSFQNHWDIVSRPENKFYTTDGAFTLEYTYNDVHIKLKATYLYVSTEKTYTCPEFKLKINLLGTFDDKVTMTWDDLQGDINSDNPLWFIRCLYDIYNCEWQYIMKIECS